MKESRYFIFLDVGDTILHLKKPPYHIYEKILRSHGLIRTPKSSEELFVEFRKSMKFMTSRIDWEYRDRYIIHPNGYDGWWKELIHRFLNSIQENAPTPTEEVYREIFAIFDDTSIWEVDRGFENLKEFIKKENFGFGIISNWDLRLRNLLTRMGLLEHFSVVLISAEFGYEKPSPKIFQKAEELSKVRPENLIYVGDKPELDYYPPRNLGWRSYLITRESKPEFECIHHLGELVDKIREF